MNKGLTALKNSGAKGRAAFENIIKSMSSSDKAKYAALGMKVLKDGGFLRGEEKPVYDADGNLVGTEKKTSGLRSFLGADKIRYDNEGNKMYKVDEKKNKDVVTMYHENGGKMYDEGGRNGDGGPFSTALTQVEQNLSPLKGTLMSQIESDPKKMAWAKENIPGGLENATVYQLSQAADPNHAGSQMNRLGRMARQSGLPVSVETINLYNRAADGRFDVSTMDEAMIARGYEGEAGDVFSRGLVEGKINLGALIGADAKALGDTKSAGKFNVKEWNIPSGADFLSTNRRSIRRDGSIRGDNNDDLTWYATLGRGNTKTVGPDAEKPEPIIPPEIPMDTMPGDPMATINPLDPKQLPNPRADRTIQGGITPLKDYTNESPEGPGPSPIDYGVRPVIQDETFNVLGGGRYPVEAPNMVVSGSRPNISPEDEMSLFELASAIQKLKDQRANGGRMYLFGGKNRGGGKYALFGRRNRKKAMEDYEERKAQNILAAPPIEGFSRPTKSRGQGGRVYRFGGKY